MTHTEAALSPAVVQFATRRGVLQPLETCLGLLRETFPVGTTFATQIDSDPDEPEQFVRINVAPIPGAACWVEPYSRFLGRRIDAIPAARSDTLIRVCFV